MSEITQLKNAILTIGHSLPMGMEVWFGRDDGDPRTRMNIVEPAGKHTEYVFKRTNPLPVFPLVSLLREQQLETALRVLLGAIDIERESNTLSHQIDREMLDGAIDAALAVLADGWEPDNGHPANQVTFQPAVLSYPTGSLGESVDDQEHFS